MSQKEDFLSQEAAMKALSANEVKTPDMPVDVAAQEAEDQHSVGVTYKDQLATVGLPEEMINLLLTQANALREAEAVWRTTYNVTAQEEDSWTAKAPAGYALQNDMKEAMRYAYRKDIVLTSKVREISKGTGNDDMVQDLLTYATLGKANPAPLVAINYDMTKLDTAIALSEELGALLAEYTGDKKSEHLLKDVRDRAFTIMKETLNEVRDAGKYVFRDQPDISKLFTSDYRRKHQSKSTDTPVDLES